MDEYWGYVQAWWPTVCRAYRDFEERKPVILIDINEAKVYAYPYNEFKQELSARSRDRLDEQQTQAQRNSEIVVFVRDELRKKLVSYNCPWERSASRQNSHTAPVRGHGGVRKKRTAPPQSRGRTPAD
ncbi:MAG: hypothetical protein HOP18_15530 [Deltaproteobacteria bacterium]|nr:hypothetical protein [Deltaproteobacteria bacterium]